MLAVTTSIRAVRCVLLFAVLFATIQTRSLTSGMTTDNCFFSWAPFPPYDELPHVDYFPAPMTPYGVSFMGESSRLYGSFYANNPMASLWREYARADRRWGGSDLTIISLELLTVFVMAPLSIYICHLLRKQDIASAWFVMAVVATGELYGGKGQLERRSMAMRIPC